MVTIRTFINCARCGIQCIFYIPSLQSLERNQATVDIACVLAVPHACRNDSEKTWPVTGSMVLVTLVWPDQIFVIKFGLGYLYLSKRSCILL